MCARTQSSDKSVFFTGSGLSRGYTLRRDFRDRSFRLIQFVEDLVQRNANRSTFHFQKTARRLTEFSGGTDVNATGEWVQDPHVGYTEIQIIGDSFLHIPESVIFGEYFDTDERWPCEYRFDRLIAVDYTNVWYPISTRSHANPLLDYYANVPLAFPVSEPHGEPGL